MTNYTIDGAKVDVGSVVNENGRLEFKQGHTIYVRTVGMGNYSQKDFKVALQLIDVFRPFSDYYSSEIDAKNKRQNKEPLYKTNILAEMDITSANLTADECRTLCDGAYNQEFLKSNKGQALVADLLQNYPIYMQEYMNKLHPPQYVTGVLVRAADKKSMFILDEESGKLVLPSTVRQDKAEASSFVLSRCFANSTANVTSLRLSSLAYIESVFIPALNTHFRGAMATTALPSGQLNMVAKDIIGLDLSKAEDRKRIEENSLLYVERIEKFYIHAKCEV